MRVGECVPAAKIGSTMGRGAVAQPTVQAAMAAHIASAEPRSDPSVTPRNVARRPRGPRDERHAMVKMLGCGSALTRGACDADAKIPGTRPAARLAARAARLTAARVARGVVVRGAGARRRHAVAGAGREV